MVPQLFLSLSFLLVSLGTAFAVPLAKKQVVLLCYPSDELIEKSCEAFEKQLKSYGHEVVRLDDPTAQEVAEKLKSIPKDVPVFISSHGNSFGGKHYLDSKKGDIQKNKLPKHDEWKIPEGFEIQEIQDSDDAMVFETSPILNAAKQHPIVLSACFSGRACENVSGLNLIASCEAVETSQTLNNQSPDGKEKVYQEPVLYWLAEIYANASVFGEVDATDRVDGKLSQKELNLFLAQKMGGKKTVTAAFVDRQIDWSDEAKAKVKGHAYFLPTEKVRVTASPKESEEKAQALARDFEKNKQFKGRTSFRHSLYEMEFSEGGKTKTQSLPGFYVSEESAMSAAEKIRGIPKSSGAGQSKSPVKVKKVASVWIVTIEDLSQPCTVIDLGISQTPHLNKALPIPSPHSH